MTALYAAVRSVHYASTLLLFGELVFALAVAPRTMTGSARVDAYWRRFVRVTGSSLIVSVGSGLAWFALAAAVMSGSPPGEALDGRTLSRVLEQTSFGHVWMVRFGLAIFLGIACAAIARTSRQDVKSWLPAGMFVLAATYVAALAWAGHAAAGVDWEGDLEILADVVHLLAAGAWLGALPGFAFLLRRTESASETLAATRRFSTLGLTCVAFLVAGGIANTWFLVGDVPALIGTRYGRLLLVKLSLFGAMLGLAITNRWYHSPRLAGGDVIGARRIRRNALAEIAVGLVILATVGFLGVTPPAIHETPVWPFAHTLTFAPAERSPWLLMGLVAAGLTAVVCTGVLLAGVRNHRLWQSVGSLAVIAVLAAILLPMLATRAYPTTYQASPIPYTTDAIVAGQTLYASNCRQCHGLHRLDAATATPEQRRATFDPTEHALRHKDGEHYWWIAHGVPGTSMPGFGAKLSTGDIWNLIEYLNAQVEAEEATAMTDRIKPLRAIAAPDFAFETADRPQESLRQLRGKAAALLVLYTLPESLPRLREVAADARSYAAAGARVIAAPFASSRATAVPGDVAAAIGVADATVAAAYSLFARASPEPAAAPTHVELLIDRDGYLRARWVGSPEVAAKRTAEVLDRLAILRRETPLPPAPWGHRHR